MKGTTDEGTEQIVNMYKLLTLYCDVSECIV